MLFKQFVDDDLGCASYLIGDEHAGVAVLVDPAYAIEQYLDECKRRDVELVAVLETHTHADHVSGHGRLALEEGLPVRIHRAAEATFPHEPLDDGTELTLGEIVVRNDLQYERFRVARPYEVMALANSAQVAITVEQIGGSPTGQPTSTPIFVAPLRTAS